MRSKVGVGFAAGLLWALALVVPAHAAFPGANGTGETKILSSHNPNPLDPRWSPDGTKIAFAGYGYATNYCCGDIYTINPDGTGLTQLTNSVDLDDNSVDWSPDGFTLLAVDD